MSCLFSCFFVFFFFFSSRRRHTRLTCDWSSDVCSSDLETDGVGGSVLLTGDQQQPRQRGAALGEVHGRFAGRPGHRDRREDPHRVGQDRKSTRLNSSHMSISYAVFCLKKKKKNNSQRTH